MDHRFPYLPSNSLSDILFDGYSRQVFRFICLVTLKCLFPDCRYIFCTDYYILRACTIRNKFHVLLDQAVHSCFEKCFLGEIVKFRKNSNTATSNINKTVIIVITTRVLYSAPPHLYPWHCTIKKNPKFMMFVKSRHK